MRSDALDSKSGSTGQRELSRERGMAEEERKVLQEMREGHVGISSLWFGRTSS